MKILGINKGSTLSGKMLRQGGAAMYSDGNVIALAEERASGIKYAGGYSNVLQLLIGREKIKLEDFDHIAVSTCCEPVESALAGHELSGYKNLVSVNHHHSHAALAFYGSGFEQALVVVADGGGNTLEGASVNDEWWRVRREQVSYYLATRSDGIQLIGRDFEGPHEAGLGEVYRAFTYYLGWHSSIHASKMMALAGHGNRSAIKAELFSFDDDRLIFGVKNEPNDPIGMITKLGGFLGVSLGEPRAPHQAILRIHRDVAAFAQQGVEEALLRRLAVLKRQLKVEHLCFAGGLALNVVANGRLLSTFPGGVYVPSAPGDDGQSLGNVYAILEKHGATRDAPTMRKSSSAYLGPSMKIDSAAVASTLKDVGLSNCVVFETSDFSEVITRFLEAGSVVCVYQSRAEFGPRSLGSRSILADPRQAGVVSELNSLKKREWFMPFAPAMLESKMSEWFLPERQSPFMSFAFKATERALRQIPAVVNADHTARVQTVSENEDTAIARILRAFEKHTGIPVLLNTSFNHGGDPIVESLKQAISTFHTMPVNVLGLGRFVLVKSISPMQFDLPLDVSMEDLDLRVFDGGAAQPIPTVAKSVSTVIRRLQALTGSVVFVRTEFPLFGEYLNWMRQGQKHTTIRFRQGAVEIPFNNILPLFETKDYGPGDRTRPTEHVRVSSVRYHRFGELTADDAQMDGFDDLAHMRRDLRQIYPNLLDENWVTVYDISLA